MYHFTMPKKLHLMDDAYWASFPPVLSQAQLCEITGKGEVTIWRWLKAGIQPGHQINTSWIAYQEEVRAKLLDNDRRPLIPEGYLSRFPELLTVEKLADLLGKTPQTAYNWMAAGKLPAHKVSSACNEILFGPESFDVR